VALSQYTVVATGSEANTFAINFTLGIFSRDYITARVDQEVDGSDNPVYRALTWINDGMVTLGGAAITNGQSVRFSRTIPNNELAHDYANGDDIIEENLDDSNRQLIMLIHQALDGRIGPIEQDIDLNGFTLTNPRDPVDPGDLLTKEYGDENYGGAAAEDAQASAAAAAVSASLADADRIAAEAARVAAEAAQVAAEAAADEAEASAAIAESVAEDVLVDAGFVTPVADTYLRRNAGNTEYTPVTPAQVSNELAAISKPSLLLNEVSAPATPSSGTGVVYVKSDGNLYFKNDAGVETALGASLFVAKYDSGGIGFTSASSVGPLAHGLGGKAHHITLFLRCLTAEAGYAVGEELPINNAVNTAGGNSNQGVSVINGASGFTVKFGSATSVFLINNASTGATQSLTNANWELVIRASR
jgi:hypothetical protein